MMTELEAILDSNLVTMVFLYGSAAMLIVSLAVATWFVRPVEAPMVVAAHAAA